MKSANLIGFVSRLLCQKVTVEDGGCTVYVSMAQVTGAPITATI